MKTSVSVLFLFFFLSFVGVWAKENQGSGPPVPSKTQVISTQYGSAGALFSLQLLTFDSSGFPARCVEFSSWDLLFSSGTFNVTWVSCFNGVYAATFYPTIAGQDSFSLSLDGVYVTSGPIDFTVYAGNPIRCAFGNTTSGDFPRVGTNLTLGLVCYDQYLNPVSTCYPASFWSIYYYNSYSYRTYLQYAGCSVSQVEKSDEDDKSPNPPVATTNFYFGTITKSGLFYVYATLDYSSLPVSSLQILGGPLNLAQSQFASSSSRSSGSLSFYPYDQYGNSISPSELKNSLSFTACPNSSVSGYFYYYSTYALFSYSIYNSSKPYCVYLSAYNHQTRSKEIVGGTFHLQSEYGYGCSCGVDDQINPASEERSSSIFETKDSLFSSVELELILIMVALIVIGWMVGLLSALFLRSVRNRIQATRNSSSLEKVSTF